MDPISHYISVEVAGVETKKRMHEMQEQMGQVPGIGKATKGKALHITLAVLKVPSGDIETVKDKIKKAVEAFKDMMESDSGFLITCGSTRFLDHSVIALEIELGKEVCMMLRHLIEIELGPWLADLRFSPHITIFTNSSVAELERKQLG